MKNKLLNTRFCIIVFSIITLISYNVSAQENYAKLVNPFIGTGGHGHTYPGATLPHGMVQLSPDTRLEGWDGCGGYHYDDSFIYGFSHTHLSGTGIPDYCDILLMPMAGEPSPDNKIYGSKFDHKNEKAWAGYYSVLLDKGNIQTEFTATERVGFHHYSFSNPNDNTIILDLKHRDEVIASSLKIEDSVTISGMRRSRSWAQDQYVYFVMKFSKPFKKFGVWLNNESVIKSIGDDQYGKNVKAFFQFDLSKEKDVYVKVSLSPVSAEGARKNLEAETPGWQFKKIQSLAESKWNKELAKIEVQGDKEKKKIFYTALYHTAVVPNINMDADGSYRGMDNQIHKASGFNYYSVFSLWDTYRAAHPLYTIIDRKRTLDYIKTFLTHYKEGGRLPVWELASNETDCMIGYHCIPVIVDAFTKGITDFDHDLALQAMIHSANTGRFGLDAYTKKGVIESDDEQENVSRTLEYAYDDWCIATFAKAIGNNKVADTYFKRAQYYKNVLDAKTGFMRPRKNGDWFSPFDAREVNNNYTEANAWQYSFYFPQDIAGYMALTGGEKHLEKQLDELFSTSSQTTGRDQSDITGLIGQYAHGNEPSHHIAYMYDFTKNAYKTQEKVHRILNEFYKNAPDGLIGNEDCGQMSAWFVLSAMGFYPVIPASEQYQFGTPAFSTVKINQENGKQFSITANNLTDANYYVQSATLTGKAVSQLPHNALQNAERLVFEMGAAPAISMQSLPTSVLPAITINPVIEGGGISFQDKKKIKISSVQDDVKIYFTTNGTEPDDKSKLYKKPINVDSSQVIRAIAYDKSGQKSFVTTAVYKKLSNNWSVSLQTAFEPMYSAGGAQGLIDNIRGSVDWRKGNWMGFQNADVDLIIDLKKMTKFNSVSAGFLQDTRAWIVMPKEIKIETSADGKNYQTIFTGKDFIPVEDLAPQLKTVGVIMPAAIKARYIRIHAIQFGKLPTWHEGAGGASHIFIDEVEVK